MRLGNLECPPVQIGTVHLADRLGGFLLGCQLDETEPFALSCITVRDDVHRLHCTELRKSFFQ